MYNNSKHYKAYVNACIEARHNIADNTQYAKCIGALNNWLVEEIAKENNGKN